MHFGSSKNIPKNPDLSCTDATGGLYYFCFITAPFLFYFSVFIFPRACEWDMSRGAASLVRVFSTLYVS